MANTLGSVSNGKAIAQRALTTLVDSLPFLTKAVTDFSDVPARMNDTITTHLVTVGTAGAYSTTAGYVAQDRTQTDATISLSNLIHSTYAIRDDEKFSSSIDLLNRFASSAAYALGKSMTDSLLALVTSTYASTLSVAAGALSYRGVVSLGYSLDNNKVPSNDRYAIISPDNKASLLNDSSIVANAQIQGDTVKTGSIGMVNGIEVFSYTALPSAVSKGFAAQKEALIVAARVPEALDNYPGSQDVVTDPSSGLSLAVREFVNPTLGTTNRSYILLFGVGRGSTSSLVRLV
jgi:hypothetical protein